MPQQHMSVACWAGVLEQAGDGSSHRPCPPAPPPSRNIFAGSMMSNPLIHPSVNMTDACYSAPWNASCAAFRRMHSEWTDDMNSLCAAMPFMVG